MAYYSLFLRNDIFRDSCYTCKYANATRVGDATIFDYWGIETQESEFYAICKERGLKGISGIIVNSEKGKNLFDYSKDKLFYKETEITKMKFKNPNLSIPSPIGKNREKVLDLYRLKGWEKVEKYYRKTYGFEIFVRSIYNICPQFLKSIISQLRGTR